MAISNRVRESMKTSSWVRAMFEVGIRLKSEHGAENVFDFSLGNPDLDPPPEFHREIRQILDDDTPGRHGYMPNGGYPDVRAKIAGYVSGEYGIDIGGENLVMSCGAGGALNVVFMSILNPGDTVITCTPCFMEYRAYVSNHGGELLLVDGKDNFDLDIANLEKAIDKRTAAVIINSPNNPSGKVYPESTIKALGEMLTRKSRETGRTIYLVSDEPYRRIVYGGIIVPSVLKNYTDSIVASSYSKELSIAGERIGWIAVNPATKDTAELMNALILCTRILGFVNAPALMQRVVGRLQGVGVDIGPYERRRNLLCGGLKKMGYTFEEPDGTFYLFPKAPGGDDIAFVEALQEELVLTVPGRGFGSPGYFRIAFCVGEEIIQKAMPAFERVIKRFS
jgi:aspartate aminotransferase